MMTDLAGKITDAAALHITNQPSYVFFGVRMDIHLSGEQTGGKFSLIEAFMPPGGDGGLHVHFNEDETIHLLAGELEVTQGDSVFTLRTGETAFTPKNLPHRLRNLGTIEVRAFLINTPGTFDPFIKIAGIPAAEAANIPPVAPTPEQMQYLLNLSEQHGTKMLILPGA